MLPELEFTFGIMPQHIHPIIQIIIGVILITIGANITKWIVRVFGIILIILGIVALL
ncbi:MAG: hypothetical protein BME93_03410 [Methanosarcinales archaeon Met12]|nr:MAG: hypothetical protein BME93_03410 [Methanosarcinales archaeon Met12]